MLTCLPQTVCSYSLEPNSRFSIWRFLKIHWGFSEKGLLLKKASNKPTSSICIIKVLRGRGVTISKRIDLASWETLMTQPLWSTASSSLQTISEQYQQLFPGAHNHLQPLPSLSWYNNQASPEKERTVPHAVHTARVNIHPNTLYTVMLFISFTSKSGREE